MKRIISRGFMFRLGVRVRDYGQGHGIMWLMNLGYKIKDWGINHEYV